MWITLQFFLLLLETIIFSFKKKTTVYPLAIFSFINMKHHIHRARAGTYDFSYIECAPPFYCRSFLVQANIHSFTHSFLLLLRVFLLLSHFSISILSFFLSHSILIFTQSYSCSFSISFSPPPSPLFAQLPIFSVFNIRHIYI